MNAEQYIRNKISRGPTTAENAQNNKRCTQYTNTVRILSKRWVILREILVRVRVVHRRVRVILCKRLASRLTVCVVVCPSVAGEVGGPMNKGSSLYIVNE